MCGRFVISYTYDELVSFLHDTFEIEELDLGFGVPRYNVAPGQQVLSVIQAKTGYRAGTLQWGFVPSWSTDESIGYKMINARSETITEKVSFKQSLVQKRCLILADGYYEWKRSLQGKIPMFITLDNRRMMLFAGLWTSKKRDDGTMLYTTTIITTEANDTLRDIHDRMPVILNLETARKWLDPNEKNPDILQDMLQPYSSGDISYYEVSTLVNNAKNDVPECIQKVQ